MRPTRISVITAVYNRADKIVSAIESVGSQTYEFVEHVIVDGQSTDGTSQIIERELANSQIIKYICESDDGIYDAINKGISNATGDIVALLHSDDVFSDKYVLERIASAFEDQSIDSVYGDLVYVDADNLDRVRRYWKSGGYSKRKFRYGWMPPHPTVCVRRDCFDKVGLYRTDFGSGADYELLVRMMCKFDIKVYYIPHVLTRMRVGGVSNATMRNRMDANRSDKVAWTKNQLPAPLGLRILKPIRKIPQYFRRPDLPKLS